MASAYQKRGAWYASFRDHRGRRRLLRIPPAQLPAQTKAAADAFAQECDRLSRLLEAHPDASAVARSLALGLVDATEAARLTTGQPAPPLAATSLVGAWRAHPSTARSLAAPETARHERYLLEFITWSGIEDVQSLTLHATLGWLDHLQRQGWAYDSRRHALVALRRASRMAGAMGLPDVLSGFNLHRREHVLEPHAWTLAQLARGIRVALDADDQRTATIIALGGLLGLRPSEILRAHGEDLQDDLLHIGQREAKNADSRRIIPVPPSVLTILAPAFASPGPLWTPRHVRRPGRGGPLGLPAFSRHTGPAVAAAIGSPGTLKTLRKSFATWAIDLIEAADLEAYMGHRRSDVAAVTARHYLRRAGAKRLRPACLLMEEALAPILPRMSTASADR